ncbi:hemerythrin domain-containing protein [Laribacter hongkongensis]|uniref:hemerythrin domain-containing protein n=2 Tax=Laribacter hongkongensis TaxID=168471 RepID=UPI001EFE648C|nr:hemerythrin domain-containing protein [Laribacter hongkongensis]MCG9083865.1 hemerythrin domain-containing protein [Laribacter hongkongensis]
MKRAPELVRFSLEHHSALVLAKRISNAGGRPEALAEVMPDREFLAELEAHFSAEETRLKREPALLPQLAARLADDHCSLRALIQQLCAGNLTVLPEFGRCLHAHVRFEERELFPAVETLIHETGSR